MNGLRRTYKGKQREEGHVAVARAGCGNANGRHNDENELDTVETGSAISICQIAKEQLPTHRSVVELLDSERIAFFAPVKHTQTV